jgi:hypothetical protein
MPLVGGYGPNFLAGLCAQVPEDDTEFGLTPAADAVPEAVQAEVQEVTDDGRPDAPSEEVPVSGE